MSKNNSQIRQKLSENDPKINANNPQIIRITKLVVNYDLSCLPFHPVD